MARARLTEESFLKGVRRRFGAMAPAAPGGIGDDAAVLRPTRRGALLAAADALIESVHFRRHEPPWLLGRKALAVNLSDVAAMGGRATGFLLTLALPAGLPRGWIDLFLAGLHSIAAQHRVPLVGGDTCRSPGPILIAIAILGETAPGPPPLTRAGARPGDLVCVSGALGGSATGRRLLEAGWRPVMEGRGRRLARVRPPAGTRAPSRTLGTRATEATRCHLDPSPRLELGRALREGRIATAAMDLSDGLALDGWRMAQASGVGLVLMEPALPIADAARAMSSALGTTPLDLALRGGEDYELLFTAPASLERRLGRLRALVVGRVVRRPVGVMLEDAQGRRRRLFPEGFDHFAAGAGRRP